MHRREFLGVTAGTCIGAMCGCSRVSETGLQGDGTMLSCCGLTCIDCGIYKAAHDPVIAEEEAERWRSRGHADAKAEWFQCKGCHGPDEVVWSGKCEIRACARGKEVANCSECDDFPCPKTDAFESDGHQHHHDAIGKLRQMRKA